MLTRIHTASWLAGGLAVVLCAASIAGCVRVRTNSTQEEYDEYGDRKPSYTASSTLTGKGQAELEAARALEREGRYSAAIQTLDRLYADTGLSDDVRQDVLLQLGEIHGASLNPFKDYERGLLYLRELVDTYPATKHRERAEVRIREYNAALE